MDLTQIQPNTHWIVAHPDDPTTLWIIEVVKVDPNTPGVTYGDDWSIRHSTIRRYPFDNLCVFTTEPHVLNWTKLSKTQHQAIVADLKMREHRVCGK